METEVARKIENSVATLQGIKHIYTKVQDGTATITIEFRLEKPTQEAVDDVRDAVSRIRSDLPGDLKDPVVSKVSVAGSPILTYTVASSRMDDEALSWFVDNTVAEGDAVGARRRRRRPGRWRDARDPHRARPGAHAGPQRDRRRCLAAVAADPAGGLRRRTDVGGGEQSVRTIATVQGAAELAAMDIVPPTAGASGWTIWPRSATPSASSARPRC